MSLAKGIKRLIAFESRVPSSSVILGPLSWAVCRVPIARWLETASVWRRLVPPLALAIRRSAVCLGAQVFPYK